MAMRGIDLVAATAFLAEIGDLTRFRTARELMGYLGLVPSEHSTGDKVKRAGITKAGNRRARRILVECSWSYRHPPRLGKEKLARVAAAPRAVREIAWKAQSPLERALPGADQARQAADRRRHRHRARTVGLHLGGQSGRHGARRAGPVSNTQHELQGARAGQRSGEDRHRATAGARPRQGNSRLRCVADRKIDARAKTGTAPDEISELRLKSANQSLITDVSGFAPTGARSSPAKLQSKSLGDDNPRHNA